MTHVTVGDAKAHATTLAAMASAFLSALASGKYAPEVALTEKVLGELAVACPPFAAEFAMAGEALEGFLFLNRIAGGGKIVPDGHGGFVAFTNSRVMPDGSLRDYDPAIDGD